jgi:hypothetical protein
VSSRPAWATERDPISKKKKIKNIYTWKQRKIQDKNNND